MKYSISLIKYAKLFIILAVDYAQNNSLIHTGFGGTQLRQNTNARILVQFSKSQLPKVSLWKH